MKKELHILKTICLCILLALYHLLKNILYEISNLVIGQNSFKSNFNNAHIKTHAEIDALKKIKNAQFLKKNKKVDLVSICIKNKKIHNGLPCKHCILQLKKANININNVYYTTTDGIKCIKFSDLTTLPKLYTSSGWRNLVNVQ